MVKGRNENNRICERLDRALVTINWCTMFPEAAVYHLTAAYSDHVLLLVSTSCEKAKDW